MRGIFYGWWIILAGSIIQSLSGGFFWHGFTVFFLPLGRDLGVNRTAISLLYGAARLEGGFEGPISGHLIDRFGPRSIIIIGATLTGVGLLVLTRAQNFLEVFIIYVFVVSFGHSLGFYHPISTAVNRWFIRRRATCLAIVTSAAGIGGVFIVPLLSYTVLNYSWRTGVLIAGFMILIVVLPLTFFIRSSPEERGLLPDGKPPQYEPIGEQEDQTFRRKFHLSKQRIIDTDFTVKGALRTLSFWLLGLGITCRIGVTMAVSAHMIPILVWKGVNEASAAYLVSLYALCVVISTLLIGLLGDRWNKALLSSIAILVALMGLLGLLIGQTTIIYYLFPIAWAIVMGSTPLNWSLIADFFGRRRYATLRGIMGLLYGTATFISPLYAGWIFDRTESYALVLITFSVILVIAASLFATMRPPSGNRLS